MPQTKNRNNKPKSVIGKTIIKPRKPGRAAKPKNFKSATTKILNSAKFKRDWTNLYLGALTDPFNAAYATLAMPRQYGATTANAAAYIKYQQGSASVGQGVTVGFFEGSGNYSSCANNGSALTAGAATSNAAVSTLIASPAAASINQVALKTNAVRIRYLGSNQLVAGRICIGLNLAGATLSWNTVSVDPKFIEISAFDLLSHGALTIHARKLSVMADDFIGTNANTNDLFTPSIYWTGFPADGYLLIESLSTYDAVMSDSATTDIFQAEPAEVTPDMRAGYLQASQIAARGGVWEAAKWTFDNVAAAAFTAATLAGARAAMPPGVPNAVSRNRGQV